MSDSLQLIVERTDIEKQSDLLHRDGYYDAEQIIRSLLKTIRLSDMCRSEDGTDELVENLRAYVEQYRSGETLNRRIDKTEDVMEEAADVIEHLQKRLNSKKRELDYLKDFTREACFDAEVCHDQLRSLWTAYCLHNDLAVDTSDYDSDILELWSVVSLGEDDTADWGDFDSFDDFMCAHLV